MLYLQLIFANINFVVSYVPIGTNYILI